MNKRTIEVDWECAEVEIQIYAPGGTHIFQTMTPFEAVYLSAMLEEAGFAAMRQMASDAALNEYNELDPNIQKQIKIDKLLGEIEKRMNGCGKGDA